MCCQKSDSKHFRIQKSHGSFRRFWRSPRSLIFFLKKDPLEMTRFEKLGASPLVFTCFAFCSLEPMAAAQAMQPLAMQVPYCNLSIWALDVLPRQLNQAGFSWIRMGVGCIKFTTLTKEKSKRRPYFRPVLPEIYGEQHLIFNTTPILNVGGVQSWVGCFHSLFRGVIYIQVIIEKPYHICAITCICNQSYGLHRIYYQCICHMCLAYL